MWGVETKGKERPDSSTGFERGSEQVTQRGGELEREERVVKVPSWQTRARGQILVIEEGRVQPGLWEQSHGSKHSGEVTSLGPRLSGTVNCHLDSFVVSGHLHRLSVDGDAYCKAFSSSAPSNKSQV